MYSNRGTDHLNINVDKERALKTINHIEEELNGLDDLILKDLDLEKTAFLIIDMIKGFAKAGSLSSERVNRLIPRISELLSSKDGLNKVFVCDAHSQNAVEFQSYPVHAVFETEESQLVDELVPYADQHSVILQKNSTNGMATAELKAYIEQNKNIDNFILIGDCTDICILQCALGLKAHFNELNLLKRVIVPYAFVDTYDLEINNHHGDLMNLFALYNMKINGIEIHKGIAL